MMMMMMFPVIFLYLEKLYSSGGVINSWVRSTERESEKCLELGLLGNEPLGY